MNVGDIRYFNSTGNVALEIREILINPGIQMWWTWSTYVCPKCKHKIEKTKNHIFTQIEILAPKNKTNDELKKEDITLFGITEDNRSLMLTIDKYNEVFAKSEKFKHLNDEVKQ